jgi:hypothetical protein
MYEKTEEKTICRATDTHAINVWCELKSVQISSRFWQSSGVGEWLSGELSLNANTDH